MVRPPNSLQGHESFQLPAPGPSSVLEYQAAGLPYVTQSVSPAIGVFTTVELPFVSSFFTFKNNGTGTLGVGFTAAGVLGTNVITLPPSGTYTGDIRLADIFFTTIAGDVGDYELIVGLTQIPRKNWFVLTGALTGFSGSGAENGQQAYGFKGFGYPGIG